MTRAPRYGRIVVLTGAGISAESGISTFRDADGLWARFDVEEVATPEAFARNPAKVYDFYNMRRRDVAKVQPNAAHRALAKLEAELPRRKPGGTVTVVTQNVDPLHERAGTARLIHMHGELLSAWCRACDHRHPWDADLAADVACPACRRTGKLRPDIVWFGEMPYAMERIAALLEAADLFVSIGTSGNVYPAAGFVALASRAGARTVELNLEPSEGASMFDVCHHGRASVVVPAFVDRILAGDDQ